MLSEAAGQVPAQAVVVVGPDVGVDLAAAELAGGRRAHGVVEQRGGEAQRPVRRQQHQRLDVQRVGLGVGRRRLQDLELGGPRGGRDEGRRLGPADQAADYFGGRGGGGVVVPEQHAAEGSGEERVGQTLVEGVWVVDGEQQRGDSPESGDVVREDGRDGGLRVQVGWLCRQGQTA